MKPSKLKLILLASILVGTATGAFAQVSNSQLQIMEQNGLFSDLQNIDPNNDILSDRNGMPSAKIPQTQNTDDLSPNATVVTESNKLNVLLAELPISIVSNATEPHIAGHQPMLP